MISLDALNAWRPNHPWADDEQIEQDLIMTRVAIEIASHPELRDRLAWRGGTCLHKLFLPAALRYSEDLDYVASTTSTSPTTTSPWTTNGSRMRRPTTSYTQTFIPTCSVRALLLTLRIRSSPLTSVFTSWTRQRRATRGRS